MTDVVLIHPNGSHGIYGPLGDNLVSREQPLWPRLIAGALLDRGVDVKIIDAECLALSPKEVAARVLAMKPKIAAVVVSGHQPSASTQAMPGARAIADEITFANNHGVLVVMCGNHPSALPERTLLEEAVDYVIDGEAVRGIVGLLCQDPLEFVPGLVWMNGEGRVVRNAVPPPLDVDDDLHGRAWHLLPPPSRYRSHSWQRLGDQSKRSPYAAVHTSLGCPYACHFCMINVFQHSHLYRMRSAAAVVDEMVMLHDNHGVATFKIVDELFVLNERHYTAVCDGLIRSGLGENISAWCYARPDTVKPGTLSMLRRAGIDWLALGIESASREVRGRANKAMDRADIRSVVEQIERAGINVIANYIVGLPGDTEETVEETVRLAEELNTSFANFYVTMAYPGSPLYDEAVEKGWQLPENWAGYSQHNEHTFPLATGVLSPREILRLRDEAFDRSFTNRRYLDMVEQRFGAGGRRHVEEMTGYKLKRNLLEETT